MEEKTKWYTFLCNCSCVAKVSICAESLEKAREYLESGEYDDCDYMDFEIQDELSYEEE